MLFRLLRRESMLRGLLGGSRGWFYLWAFFAARKVLRRLAGSAPEVVYSERLDAGHALAVSHLPEDRKGRVPRRLRKRPDLTV